MFCNTHNCKCLWLPGTPASSYRELFCLPHTLHDVLILKSLDTLHGGVLDGLHPLHGSCFGLERAHTGWLVAAGADRLCMTSNLWIFLLEGTGWTLMRWTSQKAVVWTVWSVIFYFHYPSSGPWVHGTETWLSWICVLQLSPIIVPSIAWSSTHHLGLDFPKCLYAVVP